MNLKLCYLDFEFNGINEPQLNLVSVAAACYVNRHLKFKRDFWLFENPKKKEEAAEFFKMLIDEGFIFVAYVVEAETRGLMALFGDDLSWLAKFQAIDLYLEYRCLLNHNNSMSYGEQYIKGKIIKTTPPPSKWELRRLGVSEEDEEDEAHHKPSYSLAAACFKLLGETIDSVEKDAVRGIIIRGDRDEIRQNLSRILEYNIGDIQFLPRLLTACLNCFTHFYEPPKNEIDEVTKNWVQTALLRGDYAVRTARMLRLGYPVNMEKVRNFTANIAQILNSSIEQVLENSPEIKPFQFNKKQQKYVMKEKVIRDWVKAQNLPHWRMTNNGKSNKPQLSISKDAFKDWYDSTSPGFAGAFCRYLKTKQSLNGFVVSPTSKKGVFTDFVGSDNRVRPHFGIFGSQASRSQPGAVGFIPLKAHWMRIFIEPVSGKAMAQADFASQEFLIAAILSQDEVMINAYESGDVYLAFGKGAGLIPKDGTKQTHKKERDMCKTMVLGVSYDLSAKGLAPRLSAVTGESWDEERSQGLIDLFYETFEDYAEWKQSIKNDYREEGNIVLADGWVMWADNDNDRSVGNFPVQGTGAVIMREAVRMAQNQGLDVLYTVHDSLTIEFDSSSLEPAERLCKVMQDAFEKVLKPCGKTAPVRIDCEAWSPDWKAEKPCHSSISTSSEHTSQKGAQDLERYRKFLLPNNSESGIK